MTSPRVSVIVNCFNGEKFLRSAIASVFAQTVQDWELIFWDNQSADGSAAICREFADPRVHYYRADSHTTLAVARNHAVAQARGEWVAFLDCDDVWAPFKLERQLAVVENPKNERVNLVYCNTVYFSDDGVSQRVLYTTEQLLGRALPDGDVFDELCKRNFVALPSIMCRREAYCRLGGVSSRFQQAEDYELLLKFACIGEVRVVQTVSCGYRTHSGNLTSQQTGLAFEESIDVLRAMTGASAVQGVEIWEALHLFWKVRTGKMKVAEFLADVLARPRYLVWIMTFCGRQFRTNLIKFRNRRSKLHFEG